MADPGGTEAEKRKREKKTLWDWMTEQYPNLFQAHGDAPWDTEGFWNPRVMEDYHSYKGQAPASPTTPAPQPPGRPSPGIPVRTGPSTGRLPPDPKVPPPTQEQLALLHHNERLVAQEKSTWDQIGTPDWLKPHLERQVAMPEPSPEYQAIDTGPPIYDEEGYRRIPFKGPPARPGEWVGELVEKTPWWQAGDTSPAPGIQPPVDFNPFAGRWDPRPPMDVLSAKTYKPSIPGPKPVADFARGVGTGLWDAAREGAWEPGAAVLRQGLGPQWRSPEEYAAELQVEVDDKRLSQEDADAQVAAYRERYEEQRADLSWAEKIWPTAFTPAGARRREADKTRRMAERPQDRGIFELGGRMLAGVPTGGMGEPALTREELESLPMTLLSAAPPLAGMLSPMTGSSAKMLALQARGVRPAPTFVRGRSGLRQNFRPDPIWQPSPTRRAEALRAVSGQFSQAGRAVSEGVSQAGRAASGQVSRAGRAAYAGPIRGFQQYLERKGITGETLLPDIDVSWNRGVPWVRRGTPASAVRAGVGPLRVMEPRASATTREADYFYHTTTRDNLDDISQGHLDLGRPGDSLVWTDEPMTAWPDGATGPRSYWVDTEAGTKPFSQPGAAVVRVREVDVPGGMMAEKWTGDFYATQPIPARSLQYLNEKGSWVPLVEEAATTARAAADVVPVPAPAVDQLRLTKRGSVYYPTVRGEADISSSPIHKVIVDGEDRYITSLDYDTGLGKVWYEYKGEGTKLPGPGGTGIYTKKEMVAKLKAEASAARAAAVRAVGPEAVGRKRTVEELLEAGEYKAPRQVDDISLEIDRQGARSLRLSELEIEAQASYLRHGEFVLEGTGNNEIRAVMRKSSRYRRPTFSQDPYTFNDVKFAIREEKARIEQGIQKLRKLANEDLAAREAAMQRGIERIGLEEAATTARAADVDPAATSYGFAQQAAGQPVTPGTYPGVEAAATLALKSGHLKTPGGKDRAVNNIRERLRAAIDSGEKLTPGDEKYILKHTGMSEEDLGRLISEAREQGAPGRASRAAGVWNVRRDTVAAARAAKSQMSDGYIKFMENWWDDMWGIRGLQTGMGLAKRVLPKTRKDIAPGSELDIGAHITRFAGMVGSAMTRSQTAMELMQKMAPIAMEADTFFDDVNKFLIAMHGKEVFAAKPNRKFVGKYQSPAEFDDLLKEVRLRLGDQGYNEIRRASAVVTRLYKHDLERYVKEGMIGREIAEEMNRKYQWYNPIRYIEGREGRDELFDPRFTGPKDPTKAFNPLWGLGEVGKPKTLTDPLEYLLPDLIRNESQIALNRIKRSMITLAREGQIPGVKQAKGKITLVATEGNDKVFRSKMDPKGKVSFFTPDSPGKIQVYDVPEYLHREINYLASTRHPGMMPLAVLGAYNGFMRGATVTYNPGFIVSNMLNDTFTVLGTRGIAPWTVFGELRETLKGVERSRFMQAFARAGGVQQRFYGESMEQFAKEAGIDLSRPGHREGLRNYFDQIVTGPSEKWAAGVEANISRTGGNVMGVEAAMKQLEQAAAFATKRTKAGVDIIPKLGKATEQAPRVAAAKKRLDQLMPGWRARFKSGELTIEELAESPEMAAAVESGVEATINFGRGGHVVKELNQYLLFLNAAMEGAKLPWRAVQRRPAAFGLTIAGAMGGQLALTQYNMQYEEYFDIPLHERLSSVLIMLPSTWRPASMGPNTDEWGNPVPFRINLVPKTREWSLGLGTMTYMAESMGRDNPVEFKTFMSTLIPEITPFSTSKPFIPLPELAETITEAVSNFDLYRNREIVSERLQRRERSEQYVAWTSPTIKWLAGTLPLGPLESPLMLEHVFRSVFGGAGAEVLSGVDLLTSPWREDAPQEVREGAEKYKATTTAVERRRLEVELGPELYEKAVEEARKPGGTLYNLPVFGGLTRRVAPATKGEGMRTSTVAAASATGIDPGQTKLASQELADNADEDLRKLKLAQKKWWNPGDTGTDGISDRKNLRDNWRRLGQERSTRYNDIRTGDEFSKSVYAASPENKAKYFEIMATGGGVGDRRTPGQVLLAGYYAIQAVEEEDQTAYDEAFSQMDLTQMYKERENYVESLSPEDQDLLNEELNAGRTDAEKHYHADLEYIRSTGFWDVYGPMVSEMGLEEVMEDYKSKQGRKKIEFRAEHPLLDKMLRAASYKKDQMRAKSWRGHTDNGELEQKLIYWGFFDKPIKEKIPSWQSLQQLGGTPAYNLGGIPWGR